VKWTERISAIAMTYTFCKSIWWKEASLLLQLAIPNVILQLGLYVQQLQCSPLKCAHIEISDNVIAIYIYIDRMVPYFVAASYIGRNFGATHLSGFQLANLTANLFTLSLVYGLNSACDTLAPQAFGAGNFKQVGVVAIRGFIGNMAIILPICLVSIFYIKDLLVFFGQDEEASENAATWYSIYVTCFPCYSLFMVTYKFLSAQNVMFPLVFTAILDFTIILPLATTFWTRHFGFAGSAAAVSTYICSQAIILLLYLYIKRPYVAECWPGIIQGFREAVNSCEAIRVFVILGAGGIVASSECESPCCSLHL
jgi:Na+-driven multidrug efflux pump